MLSQKNEFLSKKQIDARMHRYSGLKNANIVLKERELWTIKNYFGLKPVFLGAQNANFREFYLEFAFLVHKLRFGSNYVFPAQFLRLEPPESRL